MEMRNSISASAVAMTHSNGKKSTLVKVAPQNIERSILVLVTVQTDNLSLMSDDVCPQELRGIEHSRISSTLDLSPVSLA